MFQFVTEPKINHIDCPVFGVNDKVAYGRLSLINALALLTDDLPGCASP